MSQRTIVEFNHDMGHMIDKEPEIFLALIKAMINSGSDARDVDPGLRRYGVTVTPTHHHSDKATVVIGDHFKKEF